MIIADTNTIIFLFVDFGEKSSAARKWLEKDKVWAAPRLWRSEISNTLIQLVRGKKLHLGGAQEAFLKAHGLLTAMEVEISHTAAMEVALETGLSAYDAEFLSTARRMKTILVTDDRAILKADPEHAVALLSVL